MRFLYLYLLLFITCVQLSGQVTIGSGIKPKSGALLDLKEFESLESDLGGKSSTKGLMLPRVLLKDLNELTMGDNSIEDGVDEIWSMHVGLSVYNVHEDLSKNICPGVYVFNGSAWLKLGSSCPFVHKINCDETQVMGTYAKGKDVNKAENYVDIYLTDIPKHGQGKRLYLYTEEVNGVKFELETTYTGEPTQMVRVPASGIPQNVGVFTYNIQVDALKCSFDIEVKDEVVVHDVNCAATKALGIFIKDKTVNSATDYVSVELTNIPASAKGKNLHLYTKEINGVKFELETTFSGASTQTLRVPAIGMPTTYGDAMYTLYVNNHECVFKVHTYASGNISYTILDSEGVVQMPANWTVTLGGQSGRIIMYESGKYYFDDIKTGSISASDVSTSQPYAINRNYQNSTHTVYYTLKKPSVTVDELKLGAEIVLKVSEVSDIALYRGLNAAGLRDALTPANTLLRTAVITSEILSGAIAGDKYYPRTVGVIQKSSFVIGGYYNRSESDKVTMSFHALSEYQVSSNADRTNKETYAKEFSISEIKNGVLDFSGDNNLTQLTIRRSFIRSFTGIIGVALDMSGTNNGDISKTSVSRQGTTTTPNSDVGRKDNIHHLEGTNEGVTSIIINYGYWPTNGVTFRPSQSENIYIYHENGSYIWVPLLGNKKTITMTVLQLVTNAEFNFADFSAQ